MMKSMHQVLIVGGGIHGTFLSHLLSHHLGITDHVVVDRYAEPLHVWNRHTRACGMTHLRSPSAHNLEVDYRALRRFAARENWPAPGTFVPPYARPSLALFDAHCGAVIRERRLERFRRQATVEGIRLHDDRVEAHTNEGVLFAEIVIFALGREHALCVPNWAPGLPQDRITHLFSPSLTPLCAPVGSIQAAAPVPSDSTTVAQDLVIVGAGVSGVQRAIAESHARVVTLVTEQPIQVRRFDSDPCYIGPKCYQRFLAEPDYSARRKMIAEARYPGTIPEDLADPLHRAIEAGRIKLIVGRVETAEVGAAGGQIMLILGNGKTVPASRVILATGFGRELPPLVEQVGESANLARHIDGFPILDRTLRWHPRLVVTGIPAELELGPSAPNIVGAINAAKRIIPIFCRSPQTDAWSPLVRALEPVAP